MALRYPVRNVSPLTTPGALSLLLLVALVARPAQAQLCPVDCLNGCGVGSNQCPTIEEEFAGGFDEVSDAASTDQVMWDVDIAKRLDPGGGFRLVWEERIPGDFQNRYRVWFEDSEITGVESEPLCSGQSAADVNVCTLGLGGNPEVFRDYVVWHGGERDNVHWIAAAAIEAGDCCPLGAACHCFDAGVVHDVRGLDDKHKRKAAVTDGRVIVWWECEGNCAANDPAVDLYGCVIPPDGVASGCAAAGGAVPVASGPGVQRRARIKIDNVVQDGVTIPRSLVVYEECPDADCGSDAQIMGVYVAPDEVTGILRVGPPFPIAEAPGQAQHWPDASGDLLVWDQDGTLDANEIWGCQPPLDSAGNRLFEDCNKDVAGTKPYVFRISAHGVTSVSHLRPTVWGPRNLVSWGLKPNSSCSTQVDVMVARLERDPSTAACRVRTHADGSAYAWTATVADDEARQRAPRIGHSALFWSDTRFTGCPGSGTCQDNPNVGWACDDAIGAVLEDAHRSWYKPSLNGVTCQKTGTHDVRLTFDLANDLDLGVLGDLTLQATCRSSTPGPGGVFATCAVPFPPSPVEVTLPPGSSQHHLGFTCCLPIQGAQVSYSVELEPACGEGSITFSGNVTCI